MGVCTLAAPKDTSVKWFDEFGTGLRNELSADEALIIGGDLARSTGPVTISLTMLAKRPRLLKRSGAKLGDFIAVTGFLGSSAAGLELLRNPKCSRIERNPREDYCNP